MFFFHSVIQVKMLETSYKIFQDIRIQNKNYMKYKMFFDLLLSLKFKINVLDKEHVMVSIF